MRRRIWRSYPAWLEWARIVPYRWRGFHRWWAKRAGFFWLPCPLCGHEFGGHEWRSGEAAEIPDPTQHGAYRGVCPPCTRNREGATR